MVSKNSEDLFGKLPDEILCRIVAFLPPETALETSFLSKRWQSLWDFASVQQSTLDSIANQVSEFATGFKNADPLSRPRRLELVLGNANMVVASLASNNKLKLDFSFEQQLPKTFFGCEFKLNHGNKLCPSTFFVKSLHLKSIGSLTNHPVSSMVSRSFHFLEKLKIVECVGLKSLEIESSQKLVSLTILDCPDLESLYLKCSKLRTFRYRGKLPRIWPEDHFNLVDAMLDFRLGLGDDGLVSDDFDPTLLTIKNAQLLTLCSWTFETLMWPSISPLKYNFQFYKLKELWWIGNSDEDRDTDSLIRFLNFCPGLERLFVTIDPKSYRQQNTSLCSKKLAGFRRIELGKLKVVKTEGFLSQENEIRLIKKMREVISVDPVVISESEMNSGNSSEESIIPIHAQLSV